jgi:hypothetical protein
MSRQTNEMNRIIFQKKKKISNNRITLTFSSFLLTRRYISLRILLAPPGGLDELSSLLLDSVLIADAGPGDDHRGLFSRVELSVGFVVKGACRPRICFRSISAEFPFV